MAPKWENRLCNILLLLLTLWHLSLTSSVHEDICKEFPKIRKNFTRPYRVESGWLNKGFWMSQSRIKRSNMVQVYETTELTSPNISLCRRTLDNSIVPGSFLQLDKVCSSAPFCWAYKTNSLRDEQICDNDFEVLREDFAGSYSWKQCSGPIGSGVVLGGLTCDYQILPVCRVEMEGGRASGVFSLLMGRCLMKNENTEIIKCEILHRSWQ